jgi:hypothetical protein
VSPASSTRTDNDSDRLNDQSLRAGQGGSSNP